MLNLITIYSSADLIRLIHNDVKRIDGKNDT